MTKMHALKRLFVWTLVILCVLLFGVFIWTWFACPNIELTELSHPSDAPNFIRAVYPPPQSQVSFGCYLGKNMLRRMPAFYQQDALENGRVTIDFWYGVLDPKYPQLSFNGDPSDFQDRVFLYIDGIEVKKFWWEEGPARFVIDNYGHRQVRHYRFWINPFLFPGDHTAKIVIETPSGKTIEYDWRFTLILW